MTNGNHFHAEILPSNHFPHPPYENVSVNGIMEKPGERDLNFGQGSSPPLTTEEDQSPPHSDSVDGRHPLINDVLQNRRPHPNSPEIPPKSKLSVSFSPSVEEYNIDDYIPRVSSASSSPKSSTELTSRLKLPQNANTSIVKTVATKVQIHSAELSAEDGIIDSPSKWDPKHLSSGSDKATASSPIPVIQSTNQVVEFRPVGNIIQFAELQFQEPLVRGMELNFFPETFTIPVTSDFLQVINEEK